jgi:hypothetical protein
MPAKSLEQQLADLEDVEARLRPLVQEAREVYQDLKVLVREAGKISRTLSEEALRGEMGRLIEREMRDVVPDIAKFKNDLRTEVSDIAKPIADILDQVAARYQLVLEHYDLLAKALNERGYESEGTKRIYLPVPHEREEGR